MDNDLSNQKGKIKAAPPTNNDQLGENASDEFGQKYDNKNNVKTSSGSVNKGQK